MRHKFIINIHPGGAYEIPFRSKRKMNPNPEFGIRVHFTLTNKSQSVIREAVKKNRHGFRDKISLNYDPIYDKMTIII
jgi:hypothetical protein